MATFHQSTQPNTEIDTRNGRAGRCGALDASLAASHLAEVKAMIADLRAMVRTLKEAVRRSDSGEVPGCPLIDALSASAETD